MKRSADTVVRRRLALRQEATNKPEASTCVSTICVWLGAAKVIFVCWHLIFLEQINKKAEVPNSLIMKITANENDTNDILQTFR